MSTGREAVIPARNEASTIAGVVRETALFVDQVIVVDDASIDDTAIQAEMAGAMVLRHLEPQGYLNCLRAGARASSAATVVTLDADGEHDPADIPGLVSPIESGVADMVFGTPGVPVRWSEGGLCRLAALRLPIRNTGFGFRAMRGELARKLPFRGRCGCGLIGLDAQRLGARLVEVSVKWRPVEKKRRRAWFHLAQLVWVFRGLAGF